MFASEFGQDTWDELNQIEVGKNYGWPIHEGVDRNSSSAYTDPLQQWHTNAASPSGIVYDRGFLFIANLRGQSLRAVNIDHLNDSYVFYRHRFGRIRKVIIAPNKNLWLVTSNTDGNGNPKKGDDRIISIKAFS